MKAYLWILMMVLWVVGLFAGLWWYWPLFAAMQLTSDSVAALFYLLMGTIAWLVAFNLGRERYWPR